MHKKSSKVDVWLALLLTVCVLIGVFLALNVIVSTPLYNSIRFNTMPLYFALAIILSSISWLLTRNYYKKKLSQAQKELAKKTIRKNFELLRVANRTLDNIDLKAGAILNGGTDGALDRALAHEFVQNIRNQVVEMYNGIGICIDDWRIVLSGEFEEIEKKERALEKLVLEQIIKARKLKELERDRAAEKEIGAVKADLARLMERQHAAQAEIFSESKKLIGAPITSITNIACPSASQPKLDHLIKHPAYNIKELEVDIS